VDYLDLLSGVDVSVDFQRERRPSRQPKYPPASTAPAFFNAISFVELVIVGPKSIPLAAPARFNSRWSMPSNFTCNRQSIFYMSSGLLATGRPLLTTPAALN
jgi:hypothetical protein